MGEAVTSGVEVSIGVVAELVLVGLPVGPNAIMAPDGLGEGELIELPQPTRSKNIRLRSATSNLEFGLAWISREENMRFPLLLLVVASLRHAVCGDVGPTASFVKRPGASFGHPTSGPDQFDICLESVEDLGATPNSNDRTDPKRSRRTEPGG
jgi:hypothetical protein